MQQNGGRPGLQLQRFWKMRDCFINLSFLDQDRPKVIVQVRSLWIKVDRSLQLSTSVTQIAREAKNAPKVLALLNYLDGMNCFACFGSSSSFFLVSKERLPGDAACESGLKLYRRSILANGFVR
jgi:hypothetical protein